MAVPGGLVAAAAVGIAGALGFSWWSKKKAAASGKSACESLCVVGAKAAGTTGDIDALCRSSCNVLGSLTKSSCPAGSHRDANRSVSDHRGTDNFASDSARRTTGNIAIDRALKAVEKVIPLSSVCVDDTTGAVIGTTTVGGGFTAGAWGMVSTPILPMPSPVESTSSSGRPRTPGVTVTEGPARER